MKKGSCRLQVGMGRFFAFTRYGLRCPLIQDGTLINRQVEEIGLPVGNRAWVYQGNSLEAFSDNSAYDASYLGPFNGHVNGALIMKERTT